LKATDFWLKGCAAACLVFAGSAANAGSHTLATGGCLTGIVFAQTGTSSANAAQTAKAVEALRKARQAMAGGDADLARYWLAQANQTGASDDALRQACGDTVAQAQRDLNAAAPARAAGDAGLRRLPTGGPAAPAAAADPAQALQATRRAMATAQLALDRGDLASAQRAVAEAESYRVADTAFAATEARPWQLRLKVDQAVARAGSAPAGGVQNSLYVPEADRTMNRQVAGQGPTLGAPTPAQGGPAAPASGDARQLFEGGMRAVAEGNRDAARVSFQQAWALRDQLDPRTRQALQDQLNQINQMQIPAAAPAPLDAEAEKRQAMQQKILREITNEQAAADRLLTTDPRGAVARLEALRQRVAQSEVDQATRDKLVAIVDRGIKEKHQYIQENLAQIELDERNAEVKGNVDASRRATIEMQQQLASLNDDFNSLMDEQRYAEAEVIAKQAFEIAPEEGVTQQMMWQARFVRRIENNRQIQSDKEQGFMDAMTDVDRASIPFDTSNPMQFGPTREWVNMTENRRRMLEKNMRQNSPQDLMIRQALRRPVNVKFVDRPLAEVVGILSDLAGVNIHIDPKGLAEVGATSDVPVTLNLPQEISLDSALHLILDPMNMDFVVEDEVLKITSDSLSRGKVEEVVYEVGDLVIPIPNFQPNSYMGLPGALRDAHNMTRQGLIPPTSGSGPMMIADAGAGNGSALAQMSPGDQQGASQGLGGNWKQGPGGSGGGSLADFDTLIDLITSTIDPESWPEFGGTGSASIRGFPTNLTLVVSQTQENHERIAELLQQLRRLQDLQVTIEVRFITLQDDFFERIGVDFDFSIDDNLTQLPGDDDGSGIVGLAANNNGFTPPLTNTSPPLTADRDLIFSQNSFATAVPQFGGSDVASSAANFGFAIISDIEVFLLLQAAQGDTRSNVLQAPKVTLFNGQNAVVSDTTQRPFVTSIIPVVGDFAAAQQPVVCVLSEGTSLSVQAVVSNDRRFVRLTLVPFFSRIGEVREFTFQQKIRRREVAVGDIPGLEDLIGEAAEIETEGTTVQLPTFSFTTVTTTVSVPDGGTVLLGGIKRLSEGRTERGVPMLNKIPYVNRLFRNVGIGRESQSLMMMVTPRIIIQEEEEEKAVGRPLTDT
jgi:general secretion pathway protein D